MRWVVGAALLLIYVILFFLWLRGHSLLLLIPGLFAWLGGWIGKLGLGLGFFLFGMLVASSWHMRLAFAKADTQEDVADGEGAIRATRGVVSQVLGLFIGRVANFDGPQALLVLALPMAGLVLPLLLTFSPGLPVELRLIGPLMAFLPLAMISYLLPDRRPGRDRVSLITRTTLFIAPIAWSVWLVTAMAEWLLGLAPSWLLDFLPLLQTVEGWQRAAFAVALACTVYGGLGFIAWRLTRKKKEAASKTADTEAGDAEGSLQGEGQTEPTLQWLAAFCRELGQSNLPGEQVLEPPADDVTPFASDSPYQCLFGYPPTEDQNRVLQEFLKLADGGGFAESRPEKNASYAMVIEAPAGSGLTGTLDALALLSILSRGARVVMLYADESRAALAMTRLRRKIEELDLSGYLAVGSFRDAEDCLINKRLLPEILVTTPHIWDSGVTGSPVSRTEREEVIEPLLRGYSTLLVDDWAEYPALVGLNLPFIVDKWRLIRDARMWPSACVYAFPGLSEAGRHLVTDRLLAHGSLRGRHSQHFRLRFRPDLRAKVIDIQGDNIDSLIDKAVESAAKSGEQVLLFRKGIDADMATAQTDELRSKFPGSRVVVCYCGDQIDEFGGDYSSVILRAADGQDAVFALASHTRGSDPIIVRFRSGDVLHAQDGVTLLMIDRSARGLSDGHLLNVLRFIDHKTPIAKGSWGQLGLRSERKEAGSDGVVARLHWDCAPDDVNDRPFLKGIGDFLALEMPVNDFFSIDIKAVPDPTIVEWRTNEPGHFGAEFLNLATGKNQHDGRPELQWLGNDGTRLGLTQLQYAADLVFAGPQRYFAPENIVALPDGGAKAKAGSFRSDGSDAIYPKFELCWTGNAPDPLPPVGGSEHRYLWVERDSYCGHDVSSTLLEVVDSQNRVTLRPNLPVAYKASVTGLLLSPIEFDGDLSAALAGLCSGEHAWGTGESNMDDAVFLPGLTYAFQRVLELELPGATTLGKVLAFRLRGESGKVAKAVVWFVEPIGVGRTLSRSFKELLRQQGYREWFSSRLDDVLVQGWDKSPVDAIAKCWLPKRLFKGVSVFERKVVDDLYDYQESKKSKPGEKQQSKLEVMADVTFTCPVCNNSQIREFRSATIIVECCGVRRLVVVASEKGRPEEPHKLLEPWWPAEVEMPSPQLSPHQKAHEVWRLVADRCVYRSDWQLKERLVDCWLPPGRTWSEGKGDCDDHAVLLCAMLAKVGLPAWFVLGNWNGECHAWVELEFEEGEEYRLEATAKDPLPDELPKLVDQTEYEYSIAWPGRINHKEYRRWVGGKWETIETIEVGRVDRVEIKRRALTIEQANE